MPKTGARPGLLALDVSGRAIGVAGADASWRLASPLLTIRRKAQANDLEALRRLIEERAAGVFVVGLPLNMDGSEGSRCHAVRAFARSLDAAFGLPILLFDERLTTFAAKETAAGRSLGGARKLGTPDLDALAAAQILQDCLDALARRAATGGPVTP
jgi:putative holliday junction resolvase